MNKNFVIEYFDVVLLVMKQKAKKKPNERKRQKQET